MRFSDFGKRVVFAAFDGGEITSDAGVLLLREQARRIRLFERMADCFSDRRDPTRTVHTLPALLAQRVAGIALVWKTSTITTPCATIRRASSSPIAATKPAPATGKGPPALAGKSTLNRIEHAWDTGDRRYHQISANLKKLSNLFVTLFLDAHQKRRRRAHHLLRTPLLPAALRLLRPPSPARPAPTRQHRRPRGARNQIRRIVRMIRERWPNVDILLRGASGFARENLMRWCEGNAVDYVFGLARNEVLLKKARHARSKAAIAMIETGQPVRASGDFHHITKSRSWARPRRVIAKVEHKPRHEQRCRFLVTSLNRHQVPPGQLYEDIYCPRGDMEIRIKDCQLDLFADRMSAHAYKANQLRLIFAAFASVLIDGIRRVALKNTALANAVPSTIRLKLLKIGARVVNSVRRIKLSLPDACPSKDLFFKAHAALAPP